MFCYSHNPPTKSDTSNLKDLQDPVHRARETRILADINEASVTLDYLIGITAIKEGYGFVQYRPTEAHKKCASRRIDPICEINSFLCTLRDKAIPFETCLHMDLPAQKKTLRIRAILDGLTELSLEPLWLVKGKANLCQNQNSLTVTIDDSAIDQCVFDHCGRTLLVFDHDSNGTNTLLTLAEKGVMTLYAELEKTGSVQQVAHGHSLNNTSGGMFKGLMCRHRPSRIKSCSRKRKARHGPRAFLNPKTPVLYGNTSSSTVSSSRLQEGAIQSSLETQNNQDSVFTVGKSTTASPLQPSAEIVDGSPALTHFDPQSVERECLLQESRGGTFGLCHVM